MKTMKSAALACMAAGAAVSCTEEKPQQLNVVYIIADDLGYGDTGCYGQSQIKTPNIDRLAANGLRFTQHYSGCTVSAPSRSSLMTGLHTGHTFIRGNKPADKALSDEGQYPIPDSIYTMAEMFRSAGYATGAFGKWGLGYPGSEGDPVYQGFDKFYGYNCQSLAHKYYPDHLWDNLERVALDNTPESQVQYAPDLIQAEALKFIEANRDNKFFLFLPYILPHAELLVPEDSILNMYRGKFEELPWQGPPAGDYGEGMDWRSYCSQPEPYANFAAMVTRLDIYVGQVVDKLAKLGLDKNTIVVFTSDNGPHIEGGANPDYFDSYGPLRGVKRDMYDGGIRVPMIVSCPGVVPAGAQTDLISAFWDIMPTFAEMTGARLPEAGTDGISILPTLLGKEGQKEHEYLYWEFHENGGKQAVRMGDWKGIRLGAMRNPDSPIELYNLSSDIHEDNNVAAQHPEIVAQIDRLMKQSHIESTTFPFH